MGWGTAVLTTQFLKNKIMTTIPETRHLTCPICSQLRDKEYAIEHVHASEEDNELPEAASQLKIAREFRSSLRLLQCPECQTYYLYRSIYEFLVGFGGSYDEYYLWRLTDKVGAEYHAGRRSQPLQGMGY
ncbi:MAG: hypothetical protein H6658_20465 [Ardenticatenaceae bacterium]|nr:hypothetical protein [Ardenticatenaceae bacterium]